MYPGVIVDVWAESPADVALPVAVRRIEDISRMKEGGIGSAVLDDRLGRKEVRILDDREVNT